MDILPVMDRVLSGVQNIIDSKKLEIEFAINEKPRISSHQFEILCDNLLFYSMMSNLVKNAVAASPENGVVRLFFNKNHAVSFGVRNQGVVKHEIRDKFFDKFVTAGKLDGTGLGTYSAQLMAKVQGGNIEFYTSDDDDITVLLINWLN
jgi:K+-sensing histidine kinase KdpD